MIPAEEQRNRARGRALEVEGKGNRRLGGLGCEERRHGGGGWVARRGAVPLGTRAGLGARTLVESERGEAKTKFASTDSLSGDETRRRATRIVAGATTRGNGGEEQWIKV